MNIAILNYEFLDELNEYSFKLMIEFSPTSFLYGTNIISLDENNNISASHLIFDDKYCCHAFSHLLQVIDWYCLGWIRGKKE